MVETSDISDDEVMRATEAVEAKEPEIVTDLHDTFLSDKKKERCQKAAFNAPRSDADMLELSKLQ